jgi:histidinol phosphatase-like PHP family hydrolase
MQIRTTRRGFIRAASVCAFASYVERGVAGAMEQTSTSDGIKIDTIELGFPLVDFHVHLDNSTIDEVLKLSSERGIKFGIVEHAGTKENKYPVVLSNDEELSAYLKMLEGKPVYKGVQAEYNDWMGCFSKGVLDQLDFVLTDTMTFPGKDGRRMKLWEKDSDIGEPKDFMDRFVDWHIEILSCGRVDILANVSWLPAPLSSDYDAWWTEPRMRKVIDCALKHNIAIEISSSFKLPKMPFLQMAKAARLKFTFGSNGRYPNMGKLDFSIATAKEIGLKGSDMFDPSLKRGKAAGKS